MKKAEALGGRAILPTADVRGALTLAMFTDPEGNVMGLVKAGTMR